MALSPATQLGPYEIVGLVGAGGMGEVYRARDPRLDREIAIKVLPEDVAGDRERLRRFEKEARAAGALNHPNVLAVYDVGTHDGCPYLVTELLEGDTLRERLTAAALPADRAVEYAIQIARGLAAAHDRGIVHRDLKPENLFVTRDGLVKILDFGLAKLRGPQAQPHGSGDDVETASRTTDPGAVIGTAGYMSPEQVRGRSVDHRSDIFAFGAVLYEMLTGRRAFRGDSGVEVLNAILKDEPADLGPAAPDLPPQLSRVLKRCLEKRPEDRFQSARDLAFGLEAIATDELRRVKTVPKPPVPEERTPYPGLAAFTEGDAEHFFGREAEVDALWGKLRRLKLLGLIGPSGAGKTSFLRAGLLPSRPPGWVGVVCQPGNAPLAALSRALVPELAGDTDALQELVHLQDPEVALSLLGRWRKRHEQALLIVDQFEELFTLNPPEVQEPCASLLGRLATEADVHVLLSMRDDFLVRTKEHPPLQPLTSELTILVGLSGDDLRRAVVEPAKKRGYRFEDEALVDEMLAEVAEERGALPLLAFAVSRLWERRDREKKLLTRAAYEEIGGVGGALAQHAEATMDRIGGDRQGLVREIFRNLVTAQGTRAVIDREELLSAFPDRGPAQEVLNQLVDARLLTSYETGDGEGEPSHHRIEVVHESLLAAWPRLVRWRTQDEDGAQLRDQLKQAAHLWGEKGRTPDLLWSGTAFREFELWRDRYPGKLTALEEEFSYSMVDRVHRRKRIRRWAAATLIVVLAGIATVIGVAHQRAVDATRRAEASQLLALAQARLEDDPTEALALTTASLELSDTSEARVFVMRALWEAPPAVELASGAVMHPVFSPEGHWLAAGGFTSEAKIWPESGGSPRILPGHEPSNGGPLWASWPSEELLVTSDGWPPERCHVWALPDGERLRTIELGGPSDRWVGPEHLYTETVERGSFEQGAILRLRSWPLPQGDPLELGRVDSSALGPPPSWFAPGGVGWAYAKGGTIYWRPLPADGREDRVVSRHESTLRFAGFLEPDQTVLHEDPGRIHTCCSLSEGVPALTQSLAAPETAEGPVYPERSGRWLVGETTDRRVRVWSRAGWPGARPLVLRRSGSWYLAMTASHPSGDWLVASTAYVSNLTFWPLRRPYATVVDGYSSLYRPLAFAPDSRSLVTSWSDDRLRVWPVREDMDGPPRTLGLPEGRPWASMAFGRELRLLFAVGNGGQAYVAALEGGPGRRLEGFSDGTLLSGAAVSPSGRRVATASLFGRGEKTLRVWDLDEGEARLFDLPESGSPSTRDGEPVSGPSGYEGGVADLGFVGEATLYSGGDGGIRRWNLDDGTHELVHPARPGHGLNMRLDSEGRTALMRQWAPGRAGECNAVELVDLRAGTARALPEFGQCLGDEGLALHPSGTVAATGDRDGLVRVGRLGAGEPHLLLGHEGTVSNVAISPDLRWVASAGEDNTLRLWPMPDLDAPPLHTLPHEELLAKLRSLTNLRAVRDPESPNAWTIELDPFPGWKNVPVW